MAFPEQISKVQRCAIYTRKSLERGLDEEFNSLETQRTICSAYITSQRHKGWIEIPKRYDDGGRSGATLDRPELRNLLADIERGLVDTVVVYKLDRITRTLLDFVRLMDFFSRYDAGFVSITQNFDTGDSMGRLILNVLLTFAQFEREILSDRIRDKQRIIRESGRWAAGPTPLGYNLRNRVLQINETEAKTVRFIFERFVELGNYEAVMRECRENKLPSRRWKTRSGNWIGGGPLRTGAIYHIIGNPVYVGLIRSGDELFPGMHRPIIERTLWDRAQQIREERLFSTRAKLPFNNPLANILYDCHGRSMSLHHSPRLRGQAGYYSSTQTVWGRRHGQKPLRARAEPLQKLIYAALKELLSNKEIVRSGLLALGRFGSDLDALSGRTDLAARRLDDLKPRDLRAVMRSIFVRLELSNDRLKAVVRWSEVERFLAWNGVGIYKVGEANWSSDQKTHLIDVPCSSARCAQRLCMPVEPRKLAEATPNPALVRVIQDARRAQALVDTNRTESIGALAKKMRLKSSRFSHILRLNYLAPDIVTAILDGAHPPGLTRRKLIAANLPLDWALQRRILGFPARASADGY